MLGGVGNIPQDVGINVSKSLFAPRLGAAYRINEKTVFRTGYGITYNPLPWSRPLRGFYPLTIGFSQNAIGATAIRSRWQMAFRQSRCPTPAPGGFRFHATSKPVRPIPTMWTGDGSSSGTSPSSDSFHSTSISPWATSGHGLTEGMPTRI